MIPRPSTRQPVTSSGKVRAVESDDIEDGGAPTASPPSPVTGVASAPANSGDDGTEQEGDDTGSSPGTTGTRSGDDDGNRSPLTPVSTPVSTRDTGRNTDDASGRDTDEPSGRDIGTGRTLDNAFGGPPPSGRDTGACNGGDIGCQPGVDNGFDPCRGPGPKQSGRVGRRDRFSAGGRCEGGRSRSLSNAHRRRKPLRRRRPSRRRVSAANSGQAILTASLSNDGSGSRNDARKTSGRVSCLQSLREGRGLRVVTSNPVAIRTSISGWARSGNPCP